MILDNLSSYKGVDIRRWAKKHKVELCASPRPTSHGRTRSASLPVTATGQVLDPQPDQGEFATSVDEHLTLIRLNIPPGRSVSVVGLAGIVRQGWQIPVSVSQDPHGACVFTACTATWLAVHEPCPTLGQ